MSMLPGISPGQHLRVTAQIFRLCVSQAAGSAPICPG
jgi:hypothetical protein